MNLFNYDDENHILSAALPYQAFIHPWDGNMLRKTHYNSLNQVVELGEEKLKINQYLRCCSKYISANHRKQYDTLIYQEICDISKSFIMKDKQTHQ